MQQIHCIFPNVFMHCMRRIKLRTAAEGNGNIIFQLIRVPLSQAFSGDYILLPHFDVLKTSDFPFHELRR